MASALVDEPALVAWGREFARSIRAPAAVALSGELGTGKTTLARAIAAGLGVSEIVTSPSFALVHRYRGAQGPVFHVDAYRIRPRDDVRDLGIDDMLADRNAVVLIEWPEHLGAASPTFTHKVRLSYTGKGGLRRLEWD